MNIIPARDNEFQGIRNHAQPQFHENRNFVRPQFNANRNYGQSRVFVPRGRDNYNVNKFSREPMPQGNWRSDTQQGDTVRTCFYHSQFGNAARNCTPPCRYFQPNKFPQTKND